MTEAKTIYVIDAAGYYFRAYYGIKQFLSNSDGLPTNAIYGFANMLKKIIKEKEPEYLVLALDSKEKTFRHEKFAEYKANRTEMPEDLAQQLPYIDKLVDAFNISTVKAPGWEADDLIGAIAEKGKAAGYEVVIVSSDKDLMQLIGSAVTMFDSMKDILIGPDEVKEKFGVTPDRVADALGLMGDTSDNIPGVPGVGPKTATTLLQEYGDLESVLAAASSMTKKKLRENLIEYADQARLSKDLATVNCDAPLDFAPENWRLVEPDSEKLEKLYSELEFSALLKELKNGAPKQPRDYIAVADPATFASMLAELRNSGDFAFDTETTSKYPVKATLVGMSFCASAGRAYYLPCRHTALSAPDQLQWDLIKPDIKNLLEDDSVKKSGHNIKYDMIVMAKEGIDIKGVSIDTMVASYLINPAIRHSLSAVSLDRLGETMVEYKEVCGTGQKEITFDQVEIEKAVGYAAEDADMTFRLAQLLDPEITKLGLSNLLESMELPLIDVLVNMERAGVLVDIEKLSKLSKTLGEQLDSLETKIYEQAGEEFNINSPKQLGVILFEKLKLPSAKKTKTGFSTSQSVLEELSSIHPLPADLLEYRSLSKLKNTYADALPKMVNEETGRIHTSFNQTVAATGRLSSSDPNLQNIPIRTEAGREIRKAFIAKEGFNIISADYSQIELRLLAHFANESELISSFKSGADIHARTAAQLFDVAEGFVTSDMRRVAKTVNFGVVYGQTPFGLARELKIPQADAKRYIDNFFKLYPDIKKFVETIIEETKKTGYVTTIMGRKRPLPDINAKNRQVRMFAERNAVNTPMQGSAADLIKMAMISIDRRLIEEKFATKMILQVHDELVFEAPDDEIKSLCEMVKNEMESVCELLVPLVVDIGVGGNWDEAH